MTVNYVRKIKVLLIDTNNQRKNKIKQILNPCEDLELVSSHEKTEHALVFIKRLNPQILLLDLNIDVKIIGEITKQFEQDVKIIGLARETSLRTILEATELGARGILANIPALVELPTRIRMIYRGDFQLDPQVAGNFMHYLSYRQILTYTEMKVLLGILERKDRATLSAELEMSGVAVRQIIYKIGRKLELDMKGEEGIREYFYERT